MFLLYGSDSFIIKKQINKIVKKIKDEITSDVNIFEYSLKHDMWEKIYLDIKTIDFFSNYKVIVIRDAYFFTEKNEKLVDDFNVEKIIDLLGEKNDNVTIIFTLNEDKISKRLNIVKEFTANAKIIPLLRPDQQSLREMITKKLENNQIEFDKDGIDLLIEKLPEDMSTIQNELNKLVELGEPINIDLINDTVYGNLDYDIFVLSNNLIDGKHKEFVKLWNKFKVVSKDTYSFVMLIFKNLVDTRNVLFYKEQMNKIEEISEKFTINLYRAKIISNHKRYNWKQINEKITKMSTLIYNMNSGLLNNDLIEIELLNIFRQ